MPVINIKVSISNLEYSEKFNTRAIIQDNILKYREKDKTIVKYYLDSNILERENNKLKLKYNFIIKNNTTGKIFSKKIKKEVPISIYTNKILRQGNNIIVEYKIENNIFNYRIEEIK